MIHDKLDHKINKNIENYNQRQVRNGLKLFTLNISRTDIKETPENKQKWKRKTEQMLSLIHDLPNYDISQAVCHYTFC